MCSSFFFKRKSCLELVGWQHLPYSMASFDVFLLMFDSNVGRNRVCRFAPRLPTTVSKVDGSVWTPAVARTSAPESERTTSSDWGGSLPLLVSSLRSCLLHFRSSALRLIFPFHRQPRRILKTSAVSPTIVAYSTTPQPKKINKKNKEEPTIDVEVLQVVSIYIPSFFLLFALFTSRSFFG